MNRIPLVLACSLALAVSACSQTVKVRSSSVAPAAQAEVSVRKDSHGNAMIELEVEHLAAASQLTPPRALYVVWAASVDGRVSNLGGLKVSKSLSADLLTLAPYPEFTIFVTAEDSAHMTYPTGIRVLESEPVKVN